MSLELAILLMFYLCLMLFVFDNTALLFVLWLFVVIVDEVMEYLLNKKALACMCLICKRYLCYV